MGRPGFADVQALPAGLAAILVANDSHGDASLAALDDDYALIAVIVRRGGKYIG